MIWLYRGHIFAVVAVLSGVISFILALIYFQTQERMGDWPEFFVLMGAMIGAILCLTCSALAYAEWVPKWERDEKRTGRVPGEKERDDTHTGSL